jgi:uncharacterized membrane protein
MASEIKEQERERESRGMGEIVDRNIRALLERREREDRDRKISDKIADRVTAFAGSMAFVYLHLVVFGLWIAINLGWLPMIQKFDPTFVVLAMVASVEAIFLSTFVLITQNRMAAAAEKRAELDLQVSLLAEHEITRLIQLTSAIGERLGLEEVRDPELTELKRDVHPERVLDKIDRASSN